MKATIRPATAGAGVAMAALAAMRFPFPCSRGPRRQATAALHQKLPAGTGARHRCARSRRVVVRGGAGCHIRRACPLAYSMLVEVPPSDIVRAPGIPQPVQWSRENARHIPMSTATESAAPRCGTASSWPAEEVFNWGRGSSMTMSRCGQQKMSMGEYTP